MLYYLTGPLQIIIVFSVKIIV
eukprot:SAG25_NODE_15037_length_185_cov_67.569767_1_plen_21_part_10